MTYHVGVYLITRTSEIFIMSAAIRKSDLQKIIREEYVRVLLENSGHRVTEARVRLIAEKIETGELDEALSDLWAGAKAVGGKALGAIGGGLASAGKAAGKAASKGAQAVAKAGKEYVAEPFAAAASESQRKRIEAAEEKFDDVKGSIEQALVDKISAIAMKTKDEVAKALGLSVQDLLKSNKLGIQASGIVDRALDAVKTKEIGEFVPQASKSQGLAGGERTARVARGL